MHFDKFDLKDALAGLWKFKWVYCVAVAVVLFIVGSMLFTPATQNLNADTDKVQVSAVSYTISPKAGVDYFFSGDKKDWISLAKNLAAYYRSLLTTDVCNQYIYNTLSEQFTAQQLAEVEKLRLQASSVNEQSLPLNIPAQYVEITVVPDTSVLRIQVASADMGFSKGVIDAYHKYLEQELPKTGAPSAEIHDLGRIDQQLDSNSVQSTSRTGRIVKVAAAVLGTTLIYCLLVFAYVLFFPVINRKSDFEPYEIPVIAEIYKQPKGDRLNV